jgi:hypothetical protein
LLLAKSSHIYVLWKHQVLKAWKPLLPLLTNMLNSNTKSIDEKLEYCNFW